MHSEGEGGITNDWGPFGVQGTKMVYLAGMGARAEDVTCGFDLVVPAKEMQEIL